MLWWVWFRKVGLCYSINRTIKAETGRKSSRGKMATYHLMMASRTHKERRGEQDEENKIFFG